MESGGQERHSPDAAYETPAMKFGNWLRARAGDDGLADAVRSTQDELERLVKDVDDVVAAKKPSADVWSFRELMRHSIDAEERVTHQIDALLRGAEPTPYSTPPDVPKVPPDHGEPFSTFAAGLSAANSSFQALLAKLGADTGRTSLHEDLGSFTAGGWVSFEAWHDADHLQHARAILGSVTERGA